MRCVSILCVILVSVGVSFSLDREAFTFTKYDLDVRIEPEQQRLAARGTLTLRNDSSLPQKNAVLQISSSLTWRSIQAEGKPVQFVSQPYESDIDHSGELSEAILSLPREVAPGGSMELAVGYEGVIVLDVTRLTRIGVQQQAAVHSDWDQISRTFSAVRGIGYVVWYPVAMEAASLLDGNQVFETVGRWKKRHADSEMSVVFAATNVQSPENIHFSATPSLLAMANPDPTDNAKYRAFHLIRFGSDVPTFVLAEYQALQAKGMSVVEYLPRHKETAAAYVDVLGKIDSSARVGRLEPKLTVLELPDRDAAPFASERMLLAPLQAPIVPSTELMLAYAFAREQIVSSQWWVRDGLARYAQAAYVRQQSGKAAALDYLKSRLPLLLAAEKGAGPGNHDGKADAQPDKTLIHSADEAYVQTKAMYVWWMLNDMLNDGLFASMLAYHSAADTSQGYVQRVIESTTKRDLQWFFDDWVYHDRGLPDFRIESAFPRQTSQGNYLVTVTIENRGNAGAEVSVTVRFGGGETTERVEIRGRTKGVLRVATPHPPTEIVVNDGSVPESDMSNNVYKLAAQP